MDATHVSVHGREGKTVWESRLNTSNNLAFRFHQGPNKRQQCNQKAFWSCDGTQYLVALTRSSEDFLSILGPDKVRVEARYDLDLGLDE